MNKNDRIKKLKEGKVFDAETDMFDLKGVDDGKPGVLTRLVFQPNPTTTKNLSIEALDKIAEDTLKKSLHEHCEKLGWWPDINHKEYTIFKEKTGEYVIVSYLKKGLSSKAVDARQFKDGIGINNQ